MENPRVFPHEKFPKISAAENQFVMQRQVELMDLDVYEHVNNVIYVNYAEEVAAQDFAARGWSLVKLAEAGLGAVTKRFHIQYLSIANWGETLNISTHQLNVNATDGPRYVGTAREIVRRILYRFIEQGAIQINRTEFTFLNRSPLEEQTHGS